MNGAGAVLHQLIWASLAGYALAFALLLVRRLRIIGLTTLGFAWLLNVALVIVNWRVAGHPPLGNMYHVLTVLGCCFSPLYVLLAVRDRLVWTAPYFAFASAATLVGTRFMQADAFWRRMPALQSEWFVPHVTSYVISYALAAVAFAIAVAAFVKRLWLRRDIGDDHDAAQHRVLLLAFPLMTFGMLSGAIWADEVWAGYWSWDPKETWSLITWTLYLVYFHCRKSPGHRRYAGLAHLLAFLALLTTFILVNLLPKLASALHSYA